MTDIVLIPDPNRTLTVLRNEAKAARDGTMVIDGTDIEMAELLDDAADEIERLRKALCDLIDAIDASPRRLPHGPGPQEIGCQMRSMIYKVQGEAVEKAREALSDD